MVMSKSEIKTSLDFLREDFIANFFKQRKKYKGQKGTPSTACRKGQNPNLGMTHEIRNRRFYPTRTWERQVLGVLSAEVHI